MLVDSSVWIAYLRGDNLVEVELRTEALEHGAPVWLAPPLLHRDRDFDLIASVEPKFILVAAVK